MKRATILLVVCLVAGGCGSAVSHVEVVTTTTSATIRWETWEITTGLIKYGETPDMGLKWYEESEHVYDLYNSGAMILCDWLYEFAWVYCGGFEVDDYDEWDDNADPPPEDWGETCDNDDNYSHMVTITGLTPGTTYCFRIQAVNMGGNVTRSHKKHFTTKPY